MLQMRQQYAPPQPAAAAAVRPDGHSRSMEAIKSAAGTEANPLLASAFPFSAGGPACGGSQGGGSVAAAAGPLGSWPLPVLQPN